jgi:Rrf2 family iron-sulfur cluster assembly transcriptional regulator
VKFSTKATYGLKAMLYLADHYGEHAVSVSQIATEENISASYLEQILNKLKKQGWIMANRGPGGGYRLQIKPCEVSIADLLKAVGEEVRVAASPESNGVIRKRPVAHLASQLFWNKFDLGITDKLSNITLQDLVEDARSHIKAQPTKSIDAYEFNI